jgi:hypothetical protein
VRAYILSSTLCALRAFNDQLGIPLAKGAAARMHERPRFCENFACMPGLETSRVKRRKREIVEAAGLLNLINHCYNSKKHVR